VSRGAAENAEKRRKPWNCNSLGTASRKAVRKASRKEDADIG
jgi:hypothetical protein